MLRAASSKVIELRLDQKIVMDNRRDIQREIRELEYRYNTIDKAPKDIAIIWKKLQTELSELDEELKFVKQRALKEIK